MKIEISKEELERAEIRLNASMEEWFTKVLDTFIVDDLKVLKDARKSVSDRERENFIRLKPEQFIDWVKTTLIDKNPNLKIPKIKLFDAL